MKKQNYTNDEMFEEFNNYYVEIVEIADEMIPVEWENLYIFICSAPDLRMATAFFHFNEINSKEYVYSLNIPEVYNISEEYIDEKNRELINKTVDLKKSFLKYNQEPWELVILKVDEEGNLDVKFDYTKWHGNEENDEYYAFNIESYIEYKYFGRSPEDEEEEELFKKMEEYQKKYND